MKQKRKELIDFVEKYNSRIELGVSKIDINIAFDVLNSIHSNAQAESQEVSENENKKRKCNHITCPFAHHPNDEDWLWLSCI